MKDRSLSPFWRLVDHWLCVYCWTWCRFETPPDSLRESFRVARSCHRGPA